METVQQFPSRILDVLQVIISTEDLVPKLEETAMELKKTLVVLKREKEFYVPEIANQPGVKVDVKQYFAKSKSGLLCSPHP